MNNENNELDLSFSKQVDNKILELKRELNTSNKNSTPYSKYFTYNYNDSYATIHFSNADADVLTY